MSEKLTMLLNYLQNNGNNEEVVKIENIIEEYSEMNWSAFTHSCLRNLKCQNWDLCLVMLMISISEEFHVLDS